MHPVDRLILDIANSGRAASDEELRSIAGRVADAGFRLAQTGAGARLAGIEWEGKILTGKESLSWGVVHYLRHKGEWPAGTSYSEFLESLSMLALDPCSGIAVYRWQNRAWHLGIVRRSGNLQGDSGHGWTMLDYDVADGHWTTGYQMALGLRELTLSIYRRAGFRWLRLPADAVGDRGGLT